jgi:hypothetical protein
VKSRVDAMAEGAAVIEANVGTVEKIAGDTRATIERLESAIGRFKT